MRRAVAVGVAVFGLWAVSAPGLGADDLDPFAAEQRDACENGIAAGCTSLGDNYRDGITVKRDLARAVELYERACEGGDAEGCSDLAEEYDERRDRPAAGEAYQRACDLGDGSSCSTLARRYYGGDGTGNDDDPVRLLGRRGARIGGGGHRGRY